MDVGFQTWDEPGVYICDVCLDEIMVADGRYIKSEFYEAELAKWKAMNMKLVEDAMKYDLIKEKIGEFVNGIDPRDYVEPLNGAEQAAPASNPESDFSKIFSFGLKGES